MNNLNFLKLLVFFAINLFLACNSANNNNLRSAIPHSIEETLELIQSLKINGN